MLPKISRPGTKASIQNEAAVRRRYPPLDGVTASTPHIIVDEHGIILAWYLPGILSDQRQVGFFSLSDHGRQPDASQKDMLAARGKLGPLLKMAESGSSWRNHQEMYPSGAEGPRGSVNLSPAWFQLGHDVSVSTHKIFFSATYSKSGNVARLPACLCRLQFTFRIGMARCHLRIKCDFERNPGCNPPYSL